MTALSIHPIKPLNLGSKEFAERRFEYYTHLREHMPVHPAKVLGVKLLVTSRYEDCMTVLKSDKFIRNRATATGGSKMPFPIPMPKSLSFLAKSMIVEDDPEHRRLRGLVQKAFAPRTLESMTERVEAYAHELLDQCLMAGTVDLQKDFALPLPTRVIAEMVGVDHADMPKIQNSVRLLSEGLSGWSILRTITWGLPKSVGFFRELIAQKRAQPGEDLLSALIAAEEDGDQLSEDELVSMLFLLIVAGFETTVHLITNGVITLLDHPEEMTRLREQPELLGSAVEEILRFSGPVHGTKMNYASEEMEMRGVTIYKGTPVMPLLGAANRDPRMFENPDQFDIARDPNRHLSFSQGNHFCLGAFLARMEAKIAFKTLLERTQDIQLAKPRAELESVAMPGWYRHKGLSVKLR